MYFGVLELTGLPDAVEEVYGAQFKEYILVEGSGAASLNVKKLGEFHNLKRPIYPLDDTTFDLY